MKILDKHDRKPLAEGRNHGLGFGFLKQVDEETLETATPISACKDYLNDQVFTEATGKSVEVYGFKAVKQGVFDNGVMLGMKILPYKPDKYGTDAREYPKQKADTENLFTAYPKMQKLINYVEDKLNVEEKTTIEPVNDGIYLIKASKYWVKYPYLISLYSLIVRMGQYYDGEQDPEEFFKGNSHPLDNDLWKQCMPKYYYLVEKGLPEIDLDKIDPLLEPYTVHNGGIRSLNIETKDTTRYGSWGVLTNG